MRRRNHKRPWRFTWNDDTSPPMAQRDMLQDPPPRSLTSICPRKLTKRLRTRRQLHHSICGSSAWNGNITTRWHHKCRATKWSDSTSSISKDDSKGDVPHQQHCCRGGVRHNTLQARDVFEIIEWRRGVGLKINKSAATEGRVGKSSTRLGDVFE
jgi:hypothetical protein